MTIQAHKVLPVNTKQLKLVEGKNGGMVVAHMKMDELRRTECLCRSCTFCGPCEHAQALYQICKEADIALAVTRCRFFILGEPNVKF